MVKFDRGKAVRRYETALTHPKYRRHPDSRHSCPSMRLTLSCRPMNAHGGYALGIVQYVLFQERETWQESDAADEPEWLCISFNALTESFVQNKYESHRRPHPPQVKYFDLCVWEDQFIITWFDEYLVSRNYSYGMQWLVVSPTDQDALGCPRTSDVDAITRRQRTEVADYMLEADFGRRIFVDNDFLIITTGQGYMLLTVSDKLELPGLVSRDENGVPQPSTNPPRPPPGERIEPPRLPGAWGQRIVTSLERISTDPN